eukprot:gene3264-4087_t
MSEKNREGYSLLENQQPESSNNNNNNQNQRDNNNIISYQNSEYRGEIYLSADTLSNLISNEDLVSINNIYGGVNGIIQTLGSSTENGLSNLESVSPQRIQRYGSNKMDEVPSKSFLFFVWEAIHDKTLIILICAAVVSIVLGLTVEDRKTGWIDGTAILMAVLIVVMVTAGNDYNKEIKFRKLNSIRNERNVSCIRNGNMISISVYDIVVGDILKLESGDTIPADGLFISGHNLSTDESSMTGESDAKRKSNNEPFLLSGCQVLEGHCLMVVIAVGVHSQWGKLKLMLQAPDSETPLTLKLENLAETIGKFGLIAAILTFVVLIIKYVVTFLTQHRVWHWSELGTIVNFLVTAITIIVVAVPEGLPLAVTISLAYSMMKMMKDQNLVRHLEACETMGGATNICSDKTGTLTQNRMSVVRECIGKVDRNSSSSNGNGNHSEDKLTLEQALTDPKILQIISESICLNSTAYIQYNQGRLNDHFGSKTECALLEWLNSKANILYDDVRRHNTERVVETYPFSSEKKMSSVLVQTESGSWRLYVKGASEIVVAKCQNIINSKGASVSLTKEEKLLLQKEIEIFASDGLRTLVLAYKDFNKNPTELSEDKLNSNLTFLCLFGIKDPVRAEVPRAVKRCQSAGITVRMLTGDNLLTAKNIARECNILKDGGVAIEGPQFRLLTEDQLDTILPHLQVIARCSPTDKYRLVHRLRELGEVVAVTGDGVNDAPQLKEADVGFSMGIQGCEVAKEASDIVILDDNFSSISKAVLWGRNVYDSIRKFIQFQLTVNVVAVLIAFVGAITSGESPLRPVQLLWVNLIMDTLGALALATEPPTEELFNRRPYGRFDSLITRRMWRNIIGQAIYQIAFVFAIMYGINNLTEFFGLPPKSQWNDIDQTLYHTIIFNTFVFCQIFNEFNSRVLTNDLNVFKGIHKSYVFMLVIIGTILIQIILVEFGGEFFGTQPLNFKQWVVCLFIGAGGLFWGFCLRLLPIEDRLPEVRPIKPISEVSVPVHIEIERVPLLGPTSNWRKAQNIFKQINVISAFRNQPRLKRTKTLFTTKSSENQLPIKRQSAPRQ